MGNSLYLLRRLGELSNLTRAVRIFRSFIHFGPWRYLFIRLIQLIRPPKDLEAVTSRATILPNIDIESVCTRLNSDGFSYIGQLTPESTAAIMNATDKLPVDHYQRVHEVDQNIRNLTSDPQLIKLLRRCLNAEPVMLECTLIVTEGRHQGGGTGQQNRFHFDYAGWQSLNLFVYLTDVYNASACHRVVLGSHKHKTLKDLFSPALSDAEAETRFQDDIESVQGPAGTVFLENTEAWHKRQFSDERRVMLNVLFASHRSILSAGRTDPKNIRHRNSIYPRDT